MVVWAVSLLLSLLPDLACDFLHLVVIEALSKKGRAANVSNSKYNGFVCNHDEEASTASRKDECNKSGSESIGRSSAKRTETNGDCRGSVCIPIAKCKSYFCQIA